MAAWTIKGQSLVEDIGSVPRRSGSVWVDPSRQPKAIDVHFTKGDGGGQIGMLHGLYEVEWDKLAVCLVSYETRPTEFASEVGSKNVLIIFNRKK
ncbi:MAG TPA: TIGR03067 domain-containing protein [Gemmataceae bacterium]|nr:TIGR03067 domain-containing protein [Gemmataceae bacterium]